MLFESLVTFAKAASSEVLDSAAVGDGQRGLEGHSRVVGVYLWFDERVRVKGPVRCSTERKG